MRDDFQEFVDLVGNVPWRFWSCPKGCVGLVEWADAGATCVDCGETSVPASAPAGDAAELPVVSG